MDSKEIAVTAARAMDAKKGAKINVLKIGDLTVLTDYFVVGTGNSRVHTQAMADGVAEALNEKGITALRVEGFEEGRWILIDYGSVIVHIFQEDERNFYNIERLWAEAPTLDKAEIFPEETAKGE